MSITYRPYAGPSDLAAIMALVETELSEPYVIYTYRYFLNGWPHLAYIAQAPSPSSSPSSLPLPAPPTTPASPSQTSQPAPPPAPQPPKPIGCIVCKQDPHGPAQTTRGYIAMLSVSRQFRRRGVGAELVRRAIRGMRFTGADEVMLETEADNASALSLYEALGFIREKRLFRFYLNGKDAFRLVLSGAVPEGVGQGQGRGRGSGREGRIDEEGEGEGEGGGHGDTE